MTDREFARVCILHVGRGPRAMKRVLDSLVRGLMAAHDDCQSAVAGDLGVCQSTVNKRLEKIGERKIDVLRRIA